MSEILHFRISSGLKNIIGRELINDKYIAIFELVKNSYDAYAKNVIIQFQNLSQPDARIIVQDDGHGMNKDSILNKWLFVAYSEKRKISYRDDILTRNFAGAKGVGRFSCDRLGAKVVLKSMCENEDIGHEVEIDWNKFELNSEDNFADIDIKYQQLNELNLSHGTIIEIDDLREPWNRSDILNLKKALAKLVDPNATNNYDYFNISLDVPSEAANDKLQSEEMRIVNGVIKNTVFETLDIKTTCINVSISEDGKSITTILNDRGTEILRLTEKNEFTLRNIKCTLFFLNRIAKFNFTKIMGTNPKNYGSVFVYKNSFRIYPYGEPGQDFFQIDQRKAQGQRRFLGTRDIIGQIEIIGDHNKLIETTSRNNGFIVNSDYNQLIDFFYEYILKPLEKIVVNLIRWGTVETIFDKKEWLIEIPTKDDFIKRIKPRTKDENILSLKINDEIIKNIQETDEKTSYSEVTELKAIALQKGDNELYAKASAAENQTKELTRMVQQMNHEQEQTQDRLDNAISQLHTTQQQVNILTARANLTVDEAISALHIMKGYADTIDSTICEIYDELAKSKELENIISPYMVEIKRTCAKMMNSYNLVMNTNYSASNDITKSSLSSFINEYINSSVNKHIKIAISSTDDLDTNVRFNPLEFSLILDNIISNSEKANANNLIISFEKDENDLLIRFADDGVGLRDRGIDPEKLFERGYSNTGGTGIGLPTVRKYIEKAGGKVYYNSDYKSGFELIARLK